MGKTYEVTRALKDNVGKVIVGKDEIIQMLLAALVAGGHVLLEDAPGTGKTVMTKAIAKSLSADFNRIQFTPDLLPSDITGMNIFKQKEGEFQFIKGPVFANIILADEINRATPRTQSSLLECMEEKQVTVDGVTYSLEEPFLVIATQNPIETAGTFPLPEAQLDRFMMKLSVGFPSKEEEIHMISRFMSENPMDSLKPVCTKEDLMEMRKECQEVFIHPELKEYIVNLVQATRSHPSVALGVSPRGTLAFVKVLKVYAAMNDRNYVIPEDIKKLARPVMAHRMITYSSVASNKTEESILDGILSGTAVPTENWSE
ncbi:MAG: MoxR family ATPase [Lachnospiraceae bacterium]|nr:MoxR family ATPase [Lachnospiraceae bacterium]